MEANDIQPPQTVKEVGIHLVYISRELHDLKNTMKSVSNDFATKDQANLLDKRVVRLENKQNLKNTLLWVCLVASAIINIVVVYQLFTGKGN